MKKLILGSFMALMIMVGAVSAQETYVGAQYVRVNPDIQSPVLRFDNTTDTLGAVASITSYQTPNFGWTAEGSANFNTGADSYQLYTAMGGVTLKSRANATAQPFVKAVGGLAIARANDRFRSSEADVAPAFKFSAGLDLGKGRVKWRLAEVGYMKTFLYGQNQNNFVLSTGVVF